MSQFPPGTRPILLQGSDGLCRPTGMAQLPNGSVCKCNVPANWVAQGANSYSQNKFALMLSPEAQSQAAQQVRNGASNIGNSYTGLNLPNRGASGIARAEGNGAPTIGSMIYSLVLDNTAGATAARQFVGGDYFSTYELLGNAQATPGGFVIGGSFGTNSKTQLAGRALGRALKVKMVQFIASNANFFDNAQLFYVDTLPVPNGPTKNNLTLQGLLSADQYNPTIQRYESSFRLDGITCLDVTVPAGIKLTINFTIESEASAALQVLLDK